MPFDKAYLHLRQTYTKLPSGWNINQVSRSGAKVSSRAAKPNEVVIIEALHEARKQNRLPGRTEGWRNPADEVPEVSERAEYLAVLVCVADSRVTEALYTRHGNWVCPKSGLLLQVVAWQHKPSWYSFSKEKLT